MTPLIFLILNLAVGFYNVGTVWANEVDIFRSWKLIGPKEFLLVQKVHWKKLPYWVLTPWALELVGSTGLVWYHPAGSSVLLIYAAMLCLWLSLVLTIFMWGPWQGKLSRDPRGPASPYLEKILKTNWLRVALVTAYALIIFILLLQSVR